MRDPTTRAGVAEKNGSGSSSSQKMSLNPGSGSGSGSGSSGGGGPCGACKFLRRKCLSGCIFAPYFDSEHFAAVHKVFGASNVSKLLHHIPVHNRPYAALTISYEAQSRLRDPVYGCVAHIFALQQQVVNLQTEVAYLQAHIAELTRPQSRPSQQQMAEPPDPALIFASDLPLVFNSVTMKHDSSLPCNELAEALHQNLCRDR